MHNSSKIQKRRDSAMSPTMQGHSSVSVKMPQLQPQRGSLPGNMQPHTTSVSMYSHGNYDKRNLLYSCVYHLFFLLRRIFCMFCCFACTSHILLRTAKEEKSWKKNNRK